MLFKATAGISVSAVSIEGSTWVIEPCAGKEVYDDPETQLWEVLGHLESEYKLKRGDILRLGRVLLKVKDYRSEHSAEFKDRFSLPSEDSTVDLKTKNDTPASSEDVCKVCFGTETCKDNPLLSLCNCTGSMKFIHYLCLKTWLYSAVEEKVTAQVISYCWKTFHCEICTTAYPCKAFP